ncbi:fucolectin-like [Stegostoma tigrinum]|uniref:fucolectin-like n=1 Tax=Stegostoma tigrinum TaxID=3053191 RepID=UPI0028706672|nr:fucolectin-like [Stegostoma tigrinum]
MMSHCLLALASLCVLFSIGYSQENVAAGVRATQSTTFPHFADANNAIDGNHDSKFRHSSCSSTTKQRNPWWRVDLQEHYRVFVVRITNRNRKASRLNGAEIRIGDSLENNGNSNTLCATIDSIPRSGTKSFFCETQNGVHGRYVNIFLRSCHGILTLCEVEVFGAPDPH